MTLNYYLDKPHAESETAIYLYLRTGKQTIKIKTGQYIHPSYWNTKAEKKENYIKRSRTGHVEFNGWLKGFKADIHSLYNTLTTKGTVTVPELRKAIEEYQAKKEPSMATGFFDHFQEFIEVSKLERRSATIAKYKVVKKHLENFSKEKRFQISFDSIDMRFFDLFKAYLIHPLKHTDNTIWKDFAIVKTFMNWALNRGLHQNLAFKKFIAPQKEVEIIYLTEEELMKMYDAKLKPGSSLDKVRDVFCFGCFTGQRYSDIASMRRDDIKVDKWVLRTVKTDRAHQVPLNAFALAILEKYKEDLRPLPVISNQKTNKYLKDLGEELEIKESTTLHKRRGAEKLSSTQPKHKFITTHTARRTFITLSLEKGMRPEVVMRISGHTNYSSFKKYIKISEKVAETEMNSVWQLPVQMKVVS